MVTVLSKKQTNEENKELEKLRKDIHELRENANTNYHWELLKQWITMIGLLVVVYVIVSITAVIVGRFMTLPEPIELSKIEGISSVIFQAIITINGLIIGFVPLISFFFAREVRERERGCKQDWKEEKEKYKEEKQRLINEYYTCLIMLWHNVRSGVLRYTQTYVLTSVFLQSMLVSIYVGTMVSGIASLCILISSCVMFVVITGLFPIINIALYEPALRFVGYIIPEKVVWRIESED